MTQLTSSHQLPIRFHIVYTCWNYTNSNNSALSTAALMIGNCKSKLHIMVINHLNVIIITMRCSIDVSDWMGIFKPIIRTIVIHWNYTGRRKIINDPRINMEKRYDHWTLYSSSIRVLRSETSSSVSFTLQRSCGWVRSSIIRNEYFVFEYSSPLRTFPIFCFSWKTLSGLQTGRE